MYQNRQVVLFNSCGFLPPHGKENVRVSLVKPNRFVVPRLEFGQA
jgi:hypothetical protein